MSILSKLIEFTTRFLNPWVRYGFNKCEMCGAKRIKQIEVGLYWVCNNQECIDMATEQLEKDIDKFMEVNGEPVFSDQTKQKK